MTFNFIRKNNKKRICLIKMMIRFKKFNAKLTRVLYFVREASKHIFSHDVWGDSCSENNRYAMVTNCSKLSSLTNAIIC
jgi:hypothetical protein